MPEYSGPVADGPLKNEILTHYSVRYYATLLFREIQFEGHYQYNDARKTWFWNGPNIIDLAERRQDRCKKLAHSPTPTKSG